MRAYVRLSALGACLVLAACGQKEEASGPKLERVAAPANIADLPAPYNTADLANGKAKFAMCSSCHTVKEGGATLTGPNLHGVFGRPAGALPDFKYSDAVKNAGFVWDAEKLDHWLEKPRDFMPGTKMTFAGLKNHQDRIDLIGYLTVESAPTP